MQQPSTLSTSALDRQATPTAIGGLAVRTNLRAGLAWDDLDDQFKALLDKLTNAVSSVTTTNDTTTPSA